MNTRQEFEAWATPTSETLKRIGGNYMHPTHQYGWLAWQAATSRQEAKVKALVEALEGVSMMARCGQLDKFIGEPWLNAVHKALAAKEPEFSYAPRGITE